MSTSTTSRRLSGTERRAQILDVARGEFLRRGYSGGRIQEVADRAGVTVALIYRHFGSKEELFQAAVMAPLHESLAERVAAIETMPEDPSGTVQLETTRAFMRALLAMFCETVESLGIILFGERGNAIAFYADHVRPLVEAAVRASEATWERWPHRDYDIRTAMNAAFGMAFWHALDRTLGGKGTNGNSDGIELADQLTEILWRGISAPS